MSDPVPDTGILATGPAFLGKPDAGAGAAKSLINAEALTLIAAAWATAPTTEPVASGVPWRNNGALTLSVGIPPVFTLQPSSQTVDEGQTATFSVTATNAASYQWQKQEGGSGSWANISGATSTSYTTASLTNSADNADTYRCVATGAGGTTNSDTATLTVSFPAPLSGLSVSLSGHLFYTVPAWKSANRAVVYVEKGWGSGVYQNLYPHTDGVLYTAANGGGQTAVAYAAGSTLFVERLYNQALADESASGHIVATSASRRVFLDFTYPNVPRFNCRVGTQDANLHASERAYSLNVSVTQNGSSGTVYSVHDLSGSGVAVVVQGATSTYAGAYLYEAGTECSGGIDGSTWRQSQSHALSHVMAAWNNSRNRNLRGGRDQCATVKASPSSSPQALNWLGPTSTGAGFYYGVTILAEEISKARAVTLVDTLNAQIADSYAAGELTVVRPQKDETFGGNLNALTCQCRVEVLSKPNTAIEARHNSSGAYSTIGTTDANGRLIASPTYAMGSGSLDLRVVGQSTVHSVSAVRLGYLAVGFGQSNMVGQGGTLSLTVPSTHGSICYGAGTFYAWNASLNSASWVALFLQKIYQTYGVPVGIVQQALGNTGLTQSGDSWNPSTVSSGSEYNRSRHMFVAGTGGQSPNVVFWHQGENDAFALASQASYEIALAAMKSDHDAYTENGLPWHVVSIGPGNASGSLAIRQALQNLASTDNDFRLACTTSHVPTVDGVHFGSQANKQIIADEVFRHLFGAGRGPIYNTGSVSGSTFVLNFTGGSGSLAVGASPTVGWTCADSTGSLTVTGVLATGASQLTVTCNRTITGTAGQRVVKWCSGDTGQGITIKDSDATTPLPPEPFEVTL